MDNESVRIIILILLFIVMPLLFLLFYSLSTSLSDRRTPWLRDYDILKMIKEKPDRFLSVSDLAEEAKISKRLARRRLSKLSMYGVIRSYFTNLGKSSYTFKPADENISFTNAPVEKLTFEKLLELFTQYDFQLTVAKIIASTGLNIREVRKAIGEFKKDNVIYSMQDYQSNKVILLREPYRSNLAELNKPLLSEGQLNLDSLAKEMKIRKRLTSSELSKLHQISEVQAKDLLEQLAEKIEIKKEIGADGERIYRILNG